MTKILMDMSFPILDGRAVTRQIKDQDSTDKMPFIALIAHAMVGDREQALDAGRDDYNIKPIDIYRLMVKIDAQLIRAGE